MSATTEKTIHVKDVLIIAGLVLGVVSLVPLLAALGFMFQFAFLAIAPVVLVGGIVYAFSSHAEPVTELVRGVAVPSDVLLYRGHGWARQTESGDLVVGLDDFGQRMLGPVAGIATVAEGAEVAEGDVVATLQRGEREIAVTAPTSGFVTRVNATLSTDPTQANRSPYGQGWLVEMMPKRALKGPEVRKGYAAVRWMRSEVERLLTLVNGPLPAASLPDGGDLGPDIAGVVDERTWGRLHNAFFA
jgi:glycine cleavage system H protein